MSLLPRRRRPARSDCALRCACESLERRCLLAFSIYDGHAAVGYGPQPAGTAQPEIIVSAEPSAVDSPTPSVTTGVVYANMGTGSGLTATTVTGSGSGTEIGFDDYNTINDANLNMTSFRFIGGVSAVGGQLFFDFHNASNVFVVRLSATLNTAGNNLTWTLTTSPGVNIPDQGFLHVLAASGTTATWRKSNAPPTVGAQDPALGSAGAGQSYRFELTNTPPNAAPTIASLADSPDPVPAGGTFTLTANGVADSDGTIANVKFYRETNGLTGLQTTGTADLLLGTDTTAAPYSLAVSTVGLANGTYTYYAQATDNGALGGNVVSTTNTAGAGSITGTVWNDANDNKIFDAGEGVLAGWTVFLDQNLNHVLDGGEVSTTSNASGVYTFSGLAPDTYFVTTTIPAGWQQTFPGASGQISSAAAGRGVVAAPAVQEHITTTGSDEPIFPTGSSGGEITPSDAQSNPLIHLNNFQADPRFNAIGGQGFSVAVLDTGIKANHAFFGPDANANGVADRIVYQQDFADGDMNANDVNGHGTNVASIVGSSDPTHGGMAPAVNLIALKVFTDADAGSFGFVEAALQWCIAHAAEYNLAAINMSLGDNKNYIAATTSASNGINDELAALAG
ncbi:MAG: hypothetical protein QOE14_840, partial [Humisphaera sp.]|nr:hypothetical protein [Humisphaera sp.]